MGRVAVIAAAQKIETEVPSGSADRHLVVAAQKGDKHAFAQLLERHQSTVRAIAFRASSDWNSVDDLSQEAMFCAWTHIKDLQDPDSFRPWLASIVRNTARNWQRHQRRHAPRADHSLDKLETLPSEAPTPLQEAQDREAISIAKKAISGLSGRYREALLLYFSLGESHAEVAGVLGLTEANVRQRLTRARKKLRGEIDGIRCSGNRLALKTSTAATIFLALGTREVWALGALGTTTSTSAKLLVTLGALGGAALVACIVAIVTLLSPEVQTTQQSVASPSLIDQPNAEESVERDIGPEIPSIESSSEESLAVPSLPLHGTVQIGSGRNSGPGQESHSPREPSTGVHRAIVKNEFRVTGPSTSVHTAKARTSKTSRNLLKKHGPAVLHHEEEPPPRVLEKPSLNIQDVRRELWQ